MQEVLNATATKVTTTLTKSTATGYSSGLVVMFTKENIKTMNETGMERCTGQMEAVTRVNGSEAFNMDTVK